MIFAPVSDTIFMMAMNRTRRARKISPSTEIKTTDHKLNQLATFSEIGKALTSSLKLSDVLNVVMEQISDLLKPKNWSLLLVDEETNELSYEIAVGPGADKLKTVRLKTGEGIAGWVANNRVPLLVPDVTKDARFSSKADRTTRFKTKSVICVPLKIKGKCLGVIQLINEFQENTYSDEDLLLLTTLADYTAIGIDNANLFDKVNELTIIDDLTKLYNSRYLHRCLDYEITRANRFNQDLSMIFFDLDYFKQINDEHGHICGSKVLVESGDIIRKMLRAVDVACRYGGDEFVIVMPQTSKKNALVVASKLRMAFKKNVFLKDEVINCRMTASFGVASFPENARSKLELIHLADKAMYVVKNNNRDGIESA